MGRRKIEIQPITTERNRSVTFIKRKNGLFKKAYELGVLCSIDIAVVIFEQRPGHGTRCYEYSSGNVNRILQRHSRFTGDKFASGPADFNGKSKAEDGDDDDDADGEDDEEGVTAPASQSPHAIKNEPKDDLHPFPYDGGFGRSEVDPSSMSLPSLPFDQLRAVFGSTSDDMISDWLGTDHQPIAKKRRIDPDRPFDAGSQYSTRPLQLNFGASGSGNYVSPPGPSSSYPGPGLRSPPAALPPQLPSSHSLPSNWNSNPNLGSQQSQDTSSIPLWRTRGLPPHVYMTLLEQALKAQLDSVAVGQQQQHAGHGGEGGGGAFDWPRYGSGSGSGVGGRQRGPTNDMNDDSWLETLSALNIPSHASAPSSTTTQTSPYSLHSANWNNPSADNLFESFWPQHHIQPDVNNPFQATSNSNQSQHLHLPPILSQSQPSVRPGMALGGLRTDTTCERPGLDFGSGGPPAALMTPAESPGSSSRFGG